LKLPLPAASASSTCWPAGTTLCRCRLRECRYDLIGFHSGFQ
jgi:hypothetical protein